MHTGCTFPSWLLCAVSWETHYCQARGSDSKAPRHRGGGEGMGWKRKEKRRWTQIQVHLWKLERGHKLWLGLQIRSENWKWEQCGRNGLVEKSELGEEGTWVWGLEGGYCGLNDKRKDRLLKTPRKQEAVWGAGVSRARWVKKSQTPPMQGGLGNDGKAGTGRIFICGGAKRKVQGVGNGLRGTGFKWTKYYGRTSSSRHSWGLSAMCPTDMLKVETGAIWKIHAFRS